MTGEVIQLRDFAAPASPRVVSLSREPASIIILPVVRVERHPDKRSEGFDHPRRPLRRRRLVPINYCGND